MLTTHWSTVILTGCPGTVEDIAAALFLYSAEDCRVNGQSIVVDGGWTLEARLRGVVGLVYKDQHGDPQHLRRNLSNL